MGRMTLKQEIKEVLLKDRLQQQRSKHADKQKDKQYIKTAGENFDKTQLLEKQYFYRKSTLDDCYKTACRFVDWVREAGLTDKRLPIKEYEKYIEKYIEHIINEDKKTPRTIAKERSQLGKVWLYDTDNIQVPPCTAESDKGRTPRPEYYRSYDPTTPEHQKQLEFYRMVGARKGEYKFITKQEFNAYKDQVKQVAGIDIRSNNEGQCPNIYPVKNKETGLIDKVVVIHAKHGKTNVSEILPKYQKELTRIFESQEYRNYFNPADHCNVHQCRREYAQELYKHYARDVMQLSRYEIYTCKDGSMRKFDKEALSIVAQSLGHAPNDLFDTVHNYMR